MGSEGKYNDFNVFLNCTCSAGPPPACFELERIIHCISACIPAIMAKRHGGHAERARTSWKEWKYNCTIVLRHCNQNLRPGDAENNDASCGEIDESRGEYAMAAHVGGAQKGWKERANDGTNCGIMFPIQKNGSAVPEPPRVEISPQGISAENSGAPWRRAWHARRKSAARVGVSVPKRNMCFLAALKFPGRSLHRCSRGAAWPEERLQPRLPPLRSRTKSIGDPPEASMHWITRKTQKTAVR